MNVAKESGCDVLLLDLRTANTQGDDEAILRLMDAIGKLPAHPPMVKHTLIQRD